jgi:hypothetical protein
MAIDKLLARIKRRKYAYRRMFMGENGQLNADGQAVLADLAKFCRATASTAVVNPISRSSRSTCHGYGRGQAGGLAADHGPSTHR